MYYRAEVIISDGIGFAIFLELEDESNFKQTELGVTVEFPAHLFEEPDSYGRGRPNPFERFALISEYNRLYKILTDKAEMVIFSLGYEPKKSENRIAWLNGEQEFQPVQNKYREEKKVDG